MRARRNQTSAARQARLDNIEKQKKVVEPPATPSKVSSQSMIFSGLVSNSSMNRVSLVLDSCGVNHESLTKTTSLLPHVEKKMVNYANKSCENARREMSGFASTDTRWSGQKNGSESTSSWIDYITGKILKFSNCIKEGKGKTNSNFNGASNMMESQGLRSCLTDMANDGSLNNIKTFARDMDNKSWHILEEFGFDPETERFDPGHYRKNFDNRWKSFTDTNNNFQYIENGATYIIKQPFRGLLPHLKHWLNIILDIENDDQRVKEWENFAYHCVGLHDFCHHGELDIDVLWQTGVNHSILIVKLLEFITNESAIIRKISTQNTTQRCESFNAEIGRIMPKTFTNYHYEMGVSSAVLKHNEPNFYDQFLEITEAPKPPAVCWNRIVNYYDSRRTYNIKRRTPEMRKRKNQLRRKNRAKNKSQPGDYTSSKIEKDCEDNE